MLEGGRECFGRVSTSCVIDMGKGVPSPTQPFNRPPASDVACFLCLRGGCAMQTCEGEVSLPARGLVPGPGRALTLVGFEVEVTADADYSIDHEPPLPPQPYIHTVLASRVTCRSRQAAA